MTHTAPVSDSTLAWVFDEEPLIPSDGLGDPFEEPVPQKGASLRRSRRVPKAVADTPTSSVPSSGETYTFRFDVEIALADRGKCGPRFMKQWKRVLQAQKLSPLVSPKLIPQEARFQLCIAGDGGDTAVTSATLVAEREQEIAEELMHLRRDALPVSGEPAGTHPAGWQGVRVWMTFDRQDVETALAKKPKLTINIEGGERK